MLHTDLILKSLRGQALPATEPEPVEASVLPKAMARWKAEAPEREAASEAARIAEEKAALEQVTTPRPGFDEPVKE